MGINLIAEMTDGWYLGYYDSTIPFNRDSAGAMLVNMLKADVDNLYGSDKLVQIITDDWSLFQCAKIDINNQYKIFIRISSKDKTESGRFQNTDEAYIADYRIEGIHTKPDTIANTIAKIDERISKLIDLQYFNGDMFTDYYTDSKVTVYDVIFDNSGLEVETKNNKVIAECEGAITILINREA